MSTVDLIAPAPVVAAPDADYPVLARALTATLERLDRVDPRLRAFVPEPDRAGRVYGEARRLVADHPERARRPALFGVPVAVKDVFHVDGLPTRAGSALDPALLAGPGSAVVGALRAAGAIVLGKTQMDEFACSEPGPTRNPHDVRRTPGGSSAGSAAAVASGLCPLAVGSQTQRSVIGPAAYCGVVGYKPTYGLFPFDGVPMARSIDTVGLFTQDTAGMRLAAAAVLGVRAGRRERPPALAVPVRGAYLSPVDPASRRRFDAQVAALRAAGAEIHECAVPWAGGAQRWLRAFDDALLGDLGREHAAWFPRFEPAYRPRTAAAVRAGQALPAARIAAAVRRIGELCPLIEAAMDGVDCWLCPSGLGPAPLGLAETGTVEMTIFWSWAGLPCVSVPAARVRPPDPGPAMPVGVQCVGRYGDDATTLAVADWIGRTLGEGAGHDRRVP